MKQTYQRTFKNGDVCTLSLDTNGEKFAVVVKWKTVSGEEQPDWAKMEDEYVQWRSESTQAFVDSIPLENLSEDFFKIANHLDELLNVIL